jgi:DNA-binding Xre family transcriptional regulator
MSKIIDKNSLLLARFRTALYVYIEINNEKQVSFAQRCGISQGHLSNILSKRGCTFEVMEKICHSLEVDPLDFLAFGRALRREGSMDIDTFSRVAYLIDHTIFPYPHSEYYVGFHPSEFSPWGQFLTNLFVYGGADEFDRDLFPIFFEKYNLQDPVLDDHYLSNEIIPKDTFLGAPNMPPSWLSPFIPACYDIDIKGQKAIQAMISALTSSSEEEPKKDTDTGT